MITVSLDLKDAAGDDATYTRKIEQTFTETLVENLYTPGMLQDNAATLLAGARAQGWPTIDKLKGKFILVSPARIPTPPWPGAGSICPGTRSSAWPSSTSTSGRRATIPTSLRTRTATGCSSASRSARWPRASSPSRRRRPAGSPTRAYTLNSQSSWDEALRAAINILATDKVRGHSWAMVGKAPIVPAPVPGRCGS